MTTDLQKKLREILTAGGIENPVHHVLYSNLLAPIIERERLTREKCARVADVLRDAGSTVDYRGWSQASNFIAADIRTMPLPSEETET